MATVALVAATSLVLGAPGDDGPSPEPATAWQTEWQEESSRLPGITPPAGATTALQAITDAAARARDAARAPEEPARSGGPDEPRSPAEAGPRTPGAPARPVGELGRSAAARFGWGAHDPAKGDEFDGTGRPGGDWAGYDSAGHAGNGVRSSGQNTLGGGLLQIAGTPDATTGGMMSTADHPAYGRWEVRMRVDKRGGGGAYHPVVALVPHGQDYDGGAGDLDFAEADAGSGKVYCFIHYPERKQDYASTALDLADWHTYAIEVAPTHITWFVDGDALMTDTNEAALTGTPWTLNVQLDANQGGGLAPSTMELDYFRHYPLPDGARPPRAPAPSTSSYGG